MRQFSTGLIAGICLTAVLLGGCDGEGTEGGGQMDASDVGAEDVVQMDTADTGISAAEDVAPDTSRDGGMDASKPRISSDAGKVDCYLNPCPGTKRCYWPGRGDERCETCAGTPSCPDKCMWDCFQRCFTDGTCPNESSSCKDGVADGVRVCVPEDR